MANPQHLEVTPADQRRAAELAEACLTGDGNRFGDTLAELVDAGIEHALAVTAVLARNLAATLLTAHGHDSAVRILESTRLDAAVADESDQNGRQENGRQAIDANDDQRAVVVNVPIGTRRGPFGDADYAEIPAENAGQWDARQWHDHPPG